VQFKAGVFILAETGIHLRSAGRCDGETPKTKAGRRDVKFLAPALVALEAQKQFSYEANGTIFENPRTGDRWSGDLVVRGS
jgi:integrase